MDGEAAAQPDPALMGGEAPPAGDAPAAGDPNAPAGGLDLGPDGLPIKPEENKEDEIIPEEILKDMQNVWAVFDLDKTHSVEITHLRTIMRALDFDLEPEELEQVRL